RLLHHRPRWNDPRCEERNRQRQRHVRPGSIAGGARSVAASAAAVRLQRHVPWSPPHIPMRRTTALFALFLSTALPLAAQTQIQTTIDPSKAIPIARIAVPRPETTLPLERSEERRVGK